MCTVEDFFKRTNAYITKKLCGTWESQLNNCTDSWSILWKKNPKKQQFSCNSPVANIQLVVRCSCWCCCNFCFIWFNEEVSMRNVNIWLSLKVEVMIITRIRIIPSTGIPIFFAFSVCVCFVFYIVFVSTICDLFFSLFSFIFHMHRLTIDDRENQWYS